MIPIHTEPPLIPYFEKIGLFVLFMMANNYISCEVGTGLISST